VVAQVTAWTGTHWPIWQAVPAPQAGSQASGMHVSVEAWHAVPEPHWPTQDGFGEDVSHEAQPG
jgi:hypothetical protein